MMANTQRKNILMVGTWHLGSVIGCCLADCGHAVSLWDQDSNVDSKWSQGTPPIHEPGLQDLATKYWGSQLFWAANNLNEASKKADWVFLTYDTPVDENDEIVFDVVEDGFNAILKAGFSKTANFFFTAQLPVGTSRRFLSRIREVEPAWSGSVFYMPENLRLGEAIKSFKTPDRMVVGSHHDTMEARKAAVHQFLDLIGDHKTPVNVMSLESAEMTKHALNAFLATCVVFGNEVAEICEKSGADAWDVMASLKQDSRVGPKAFLRPGLGFSGGTLARDVKTLNKLSNKTQDFFANLYQLNQRRNDWILGQLERRIESLQGRKIVLLGVTYKPGTSTVRRSPALDIGKLLRSKGAMCVALDPMADLNELKPEERKELPFEVLKDPAPAFAGASAAVLITEWPEFLGLSFDQLGRSMTLKLIVDSKNHFAKTESLKAFEVIVPGKPL